MRAETARVLFTTARLGNCCGPGSGLFDSVVPRPDYVPVAGGDPTDGIEVPDHGTFACLVGVAACAMKVGIDMAAATGIPGLAERAVANNDEFLTSLRAVRCDNLGRSFVFY